MRVAIFGAGAIGGHLGVKLHQAGVDVVFVARGAHLAAMQRNGVTLRSAGETITVHPPCTDDVTAFGHPDYVFVTLKAPALPAAAPQIAAMMGPETALVTGINGVPYWYFYGVDSPWRDRVVESVDPGGTLWRTLPPSQVIGSVIYTAAEVTAPGIIDHTYGDRISLGESEFVYEVVPASPPDPPETPVAAGVPPAPTDAEGIPAPEPTGGEAGPELEPSDSAGVVPTDDGDEARDSSAAVPLLAAPIPERTLEFEDPDAGAGGSAMPPLPPAPRAAGTGAVRLPPAAISRMPRGGPTAEDQADEAPRRARRVRGWDPQLPGVGSTGRRLALAGIAAAIAAIAVVVVLLASGGGTKGTSSSSTAATSSAAPARSSITVAVLNGTTTTGLAGRLSKKLVGEGFAKGVVADASSQTAATTSVGYTNGNKVAADEVARALRLSATSVVPVTSANDATASAAGGRPQVVVTIGVQHPQ